MFLLKGKLDVAAVSKGHLQSFMNISDLSLGYCYLRLKKREKSNGNISENTTFSLLFLFMIALNATSLFNYFHFYLISH